MSLPSQSSLFALVDAASLLPPIPSNRDLASATLVSDDDDLARSTSTCLSTSSSPSPSLSDCAANLPRKKSRALPLILMELLSDPSQSDVLSFSDDGSSFIILRPHAFAAGQMRTVFRCVKFPTFVKKLEKWGFRQIKRPGDQSGNRNERLVFAHPLFRRGDWDSCRRIRSSKIGGGGGSPAPVSSTSSEGGRRGGKRARSPSDAQSLSNASSRSASPSSLSDPPTRSSSPAFAPIHQGPRSLFLSSAFEKRVEAMTRYLRTDSSSSLLPSLSQEEVDRATRSVVGAAVEALERDSDMKQARAERTQRRLREMRAASGLAMQFPPPSSIGAVPGFPLALGSSPRSTLGLLGPVGLEGDVDSLAMLRLEVANATAATRMELEFLRRQRGL